MSRLSSSPTQLAGLGVMLLCYTPLGGVCARSFVADFSILVVMHGQSIARTQVGEKKWLADTTQERKLGQSLAFSKTPLRQGALSVPIDPYLPLTITRACWGTWT